MTIPALDVTDYDVLNVVALKKMVTAAAVAELCGRDADDVEAVLARLAEQGLVVAAAGSVFPSDTTEAALAAAASEHYAGIRADGDVIELVERFETVNSQFLTTMSAWQQIDVGGQKVANDHSDAAYDDKVIGRIDKLVARLGPLLEALSAHDDRFARYPRRFAAAVGGIDAGHHDLVSSPTIDSVHTVWFEFHEDLLRTLGRERTE